MGIGFIDAFLADEGGVAALDYGFFVAFVAAALLVGAQALSVSVGSLYNAVAEAVGDSVSNAVGQ